MQPSTTLSQEKTVCGQTKTFILVSLPQVKTEVQEAQTTAHLINIALI